MQKIKLLLVPFLAMLGGVVGYFLAPPQPLYPFAPSQQELDLIFYIERHISIHVGFFAALFSIAASRLVNASITISIASSVLVGLLGGALEDLRMGTTPHYSFNDSSSFILGCLACYGLAHIVFTYLDKNDA
jgi:hypothetical protein